jgi:hypothetical protein
MMADSLWPEGKRFAFTVFDDTDGATLENVRMAYAFLADCGLRTTKSVWTVAGDPQRGTFAAQTCEDAPYLQWLRNLQAQGFEIAAHSCTWHGLPRNEIRAALDRFAALFGHYPATMANHTGVEDSMYWGNARLTGWRVLLYNLLTRLRHRGTYRGHLEGDAHFWGDLCQERIKYFRNFTFRDINTLKACPFMPYHDSTKPYVNHWFASSDGHNIDSFNDCISEFNQDRLEEEGGACIMYTHFASGFQENGGLNAKFQRLVRRLSRKNGWFVPVVTLLDHLLQINCHHHITDAERARLERKWLGEKIFLGTT